MISKRTLHNALQKAQADTIDLLSAEMSHHALCWRSIHSVPHYAELVVARLKPLTIEMDQTQKSQLAEGVQWLQINHESAAKEILDAYASVTRRTVIVLADIVENLVEATIGICLLHLDPTETSIREVTSFKRQAGTERLLKQAVRVWESRLFENLPTRTQRIEYMIKAFFPLFVCPQDFELLDRLFAARNEFTHEMIRLAEVATVKSAEHWSLTDVDQAFKVASDFLIAVMTAIPGDLTAPLRPL